jgi:hypothetical protein
MAVDDTISVREAVETYLAATGSSPSLEEQIIAELREPGTLPLDLLGDPLPYFIKDGLAVVERARFETLMAHVRDRQHRAEAGTR